MAATPAEPEATPQAAPAVPALAPAAAQATPSADEPTLDPETDEEVKIAPIVEPKKWSLRAGGKSLELSEEELVERAKMGIDYEQKTQRLAAERREAQQVFTELQKRQAWLDQIAKDPQLFNQYRQALAQAYGLPEDPSEVVTAEQALKMTQMQLQQQMQSLRQEQETREWEREVTHLTSDYEKTVTQHVAHLQAKFPILDSLDDLEGVLKLDVAKIIAQSPTDDIAEVQKLMTAAAQKRAEKLTAKINDHKKMEAVRAAKLTTNRIDPPGGQGVRPAPSPQKLTLGSQELRQQAIADLSEAFSRKR